MCVIFIYDQKLTYSMCQVSLVVKYSNQKEPAGMSSLEPVRLFGRLRYGIHNLPIGDSFQ